MKLVTVIGARPQFIKAAALSRVIRDNYQGQINEVLIHTGQHFDHNMSKVFFEELDIPHPKYNLEISGGHHGAMTGRMLEAVESVLIQEKPDWLLVYGDTNSTLAGALAAAKLHIPIAHVEAGLRSFNMRMPEEINRILADRVSKLLFCPTETAVNNLSSEGINNGVHHVGDVMYDVALFYGDRARENSNVLHSLGLSSGEFVLATCHRAENTDDPQKLGSILSALVEISKTIKVVLPLHPRTHKLILDYELIHLLPNLIITEPLPFLDMIALEQSSRVILTDSGGVQKEAFFYNVPCITMRDETEWVETVHLGWNTLVGASTNSILSTFNEVIGSPSTVMNAKPYGTGEAASKILALLH
jgi:UDP-GlcNAc3NAcA epimerase